MRFAFFLFNLLITLAFSMQLKAQSRLYFDSWPIHIQDSLNNQGEITGGANAPMYSMLDVNNDSKKDLFVFDRHSRKILVYLFVEGKYIHSPKYESLFPTVSNWVLFKDYNKDGKEDLWTRNDYLNSVTLFKNVTVAGDPYCRFELVSEALRAYNFNPFIDTSNIFCDKNNIPSIEDVDNDGDIDFITLQSTGLGVTLFLNNCIENNLSLDPPSFEMPDDCWSDFSESANSNEIFLTRYPFCRRTYYRYKKHAGGSSILLFDRDADGDKDVLLGNAGYSELIFLENGKADFAMKRDSIIAFEMSYPRIPAKADIFAAAYLLNTNEGHFLTVAPAETDDMSARPSQNGIIQVFKDVDESQKYDFQIDTVNWLNKLFIKKGAYSSPAMGDINGDGKADLLIAHNGDVRQTGGLSDRVTCYLGSGQNKFSFYSDDFIALSKDSLKGVSIQLNDMNQDGLPDLLLGNKGGEIHILKNISTTNNIQFEKSNWASGISLPDSNATPSGIDLDNDGRTDIVSGSRKGNLYFFRNTGTNGSPVFNLVSDSLGRRNFNPLVIQTIYNPFTNQWVDSLVNNMEGYTSVAALEDSAGVIGVIVGNMEGSIKCFKWNQTQSYNAYWEEDTSFLLLNTVKGIHNVGDYAKVSTFGQKNEIYLLSGSARGGVDAFVLKQTLGIENRDVLLPEVLIYPNPADKVVFIRTEPNISHSEIVDLQGKVISLFKGNELSVEDLMPGYYLLRIHFQNHIIVTHKLIISR